MNDGKQDDYVEPTPEDKLLAVSWDLRKSNGVLTVEAAKWKARAEKAEGVVEYLQVLIPQLKEHDTPEAQYALDWVEGALTHNGIPLESEASKKKVEDLKKLEE